VRDGGAAGLGQQLQRAFRSTPRLERILTSITAASPGERVRIAIGPIFTLAASSFR
jgi:hypothetical protein